MKFDFHLHSWFSYDGLQSPAWILRWADFVNLDAVAITDHDSFLGSRRALDICDSFDVAVVGGMEVRTVEYGDLLALFIDEPIESREFDSVVGEIHDQNGIAVLPHPYRKFDTVPEWVIDAVDALEGRNARSTDEQNDRARSLATRTRLPVLGGSDAHAPWEIGTVHTETTIPVESIDSLPSVLRDGETRLLGDGLPYYLTHGTSYATELVKRRFAPNQAYLGGL